MILEVAAFMVVGAVGYLCGLVATYRKLQDDLDRAEWHLRQCEDLHRRVERGQDSPEAMLH